MRQINYKIDRIQQAMLKDPEWDFSVPLSFEYYEGKTLRVTVLPSLKKAVRTHFKTYNNALFSDASLAALFNIVAYEMKIRGFAVDPFPDTCGTIFHLTGNRVDKALILPQTRRLTAKDEESNETEYDLKYSFMEKNVLFGTVCDAKVVSVASTNGALPKKPGIVEIGVETVAEHLRKGYGSSNVAALCNFLLALGYTPEYRTEKSNKASLALAEGLGFHPVGEFANFVGRKNS